MPINDTLPAFAAPAETHASIRDELLYVIARASAPFERASLPCFGAPRRPVSDRVAERREEEWIRLVARGDRQAFADLLAARGLDIAHARRGLADVDVTDAETLPLWARDVLTLWSEDPIDVDVEPIPAFALGELADAHSLRLVGADAAAAWPLHGLFEPLIRRGAAQLRTIANESVVPIGAAAQRQLLAALAQRLCSHWNTLLYHRVSVADILADHPGAAGQTIQGAFFGDDAPVLHQWAAFLRSYPVLARLIAVAYRNWCTTTAELIARLNVDRARLCSTFLPDTPDTPDTLGTLGALTECSVGMGDSHDHGRSVAILTFGSGTRVVYKPKDIGVATAYMQLADALNAEGIEPQLPTRRIVEGDGYGWEEFVAQAACESLDGVRRFYVQIGMHARLVQLLDGMDFTGDNVIAGGDAPALVDLEVLLAPHIPLPGQAPSADEVLTRGFDSPARGCLISAKILGERGRPAAELAALAPSTECVAPFKQRVLRSSANGPTLVDAYPEFPGFRATPSLNGVRMQSTDFFDDVVAGYVQMGEHLRRLHAHLASETGPLAPLRHVLVRCLCRDTHIYARMLQSSVTPARLRDGVERELCLERMWMARFSNVAVVAAEIESLRELDIPLFASCPSSAPLFQEGAVLVEDFFVETAWDRLTERVRAIPSSTREHDRELIESVLFTLAPPVRRRVAPSAVMPARVADWLAAAEHVGMEIVAAAAGSTDAPKWIGGKYHPWNDCWTFGVVSDDLYSGAAGIGLVLAELARATRSSELARVASATLHGLGRRLAHVPAQMRANPVAHPPGASFGWSGRLYACDRGSALLDDDSLGDGPATLVKSLAQLGRAELSELLGRADAYDVGTGAAGLMLVARAVRAGSDADRAEIAAAIGELLAERAANGAMDTPLYPTHAHPRGVIARVLDSAGVMAAMPTLGDQLSILSAARADARLRDVALGSVERALSEAITDGDGLRWLERGELALAAHAVANGSGYLAIAEDAGERLCALKARTGRWLPECLLADRYNLSAVVGLGAVAHFLLQLAAPGRLQSYRTLE
ncbi:MAG: type 2 lanthipeptide synthetase LanM [bacterium]